MKTKIVVLTFAITFSIQLQSAFAWQAKTQKPIKEKTIVLEESGDLVLTKGKKEKPTSILKSGPKATWIWGGKPRNDDRYLIKREFSFSGDRGELVATCDNTMTIRLNGKEIGESSSWESPIRRNITKQLKQGKNEIVFDVGNQGSAAGLAVKIALQNGKKITYIVSDRTWTAAKPGSNEFGRVTTHGKMGARPWGDVFNRPASGTPLPTQASDAFQVLAGFEVERLYDVDKGTQGSWVCITFDNKGRIIASDQGGKGLWRITPAPLSGDGVTRVEKLNVRMSSAQGMLYAFDSLYVSANGGPGSGVYRLKDTNGDDQFDSVEKLFSLRGGGEHGPHALRLAPDGKSIYTIAGNHTDPPSFDHSTIPNNWGEDHLLPRQWDARGHARGKLAPGGWICRFSPDGKKREIVSIGYRNPYDMDFNADGELFAYDADMEWDLGTPWYRPTRVVHATSASEFGWRSGTGKWPTYYADSLPPATDIGPGSPTGVSFGTGAKFPAKYQKALYLVDWTFGTIYAIHLTPQGASYLGKKEEFVSRAPLPLTDIAVGPDGAMYFTIGGRGTQSALFRVTYKGSESTSRVDGRDEAGREARQQRRALESLHRKLSGPQLEEGIATAWNALASDDRHIRYAARIVLEHQPVEAWVGRLRDESNTSVLTEAVIGLARQGKAADLKTALGALDRIPFKEIGDDQKLAVLRAYSLSFIRLGRPAKSYNAKLAEKLEPHFPAKDPRVGRELARVLVYLDSPKVIDKALAILEKKDSESNQVLPQLLARNRGYGSTIARMIANRPAIDKIHYAFVLRNMLFGWTLEQRRKYFQWLHDATQRSGGASYEGFIKNIRAEALAKTSPAERAAIEKSVVAAPPKLDDLPKPKGPGKKWTVAELVSVTKSGTRSFENGKRSFLAAKCANCHRFDGSGGNTGPDLTNVAGRFSEKDFLESMIVPSKVISDQYQAHLIETADGKRITGRIVSQDGKTYTINTDAFDGTKLVELKKDDVESIKPSRVSLMPTGLLDPLNEREILDLIAYVLSRGNPKDTLFSQPKP